jgi:flagellar motor switch/type III secretory pathway protein FliN
MAVTGDWMQMRCGRERKARSGVRGLFWSGALLVSALLLSGLGGASPAQAATLEGQHFEDTLVLSDRTLRLNGLGLRGVAWIKAFVAGLYLSAPTKESAQILSMPGPKRLRLKIMLDAPAHELTRSLQGRIQDHEPEAVQAKLGDRPGKLGALIDGLGDLHPGDIVDLDYIPDKGVSLRYNDKTIGAPVVGDDLYRAVLKIFVGDHPIDRRMKEGLLGGGV